ncbi:MAG: YciI family protein [Janthinobacterium lividum]
MPQWMVTARNGSDDDVSARRAAARPAHIENVTALAASGHILVGGALLDGHGGPIGSVAIVDFPDRAALDVWLTTDPYATGHVWENIELLPVVVAVRAP